MLWNIWHFIFKKLLFIVRANKTSPRVWSAAAVQTLLGNLLMWNILALDTLLSRRQPQDKCFLIGPAPCQIICCCGFLFPFFFLFYALGFLLPPPNSQVTKTAWLWSTIITTSEQVPVTVQHHLWRSKGIAGETWLWVNSFLIIVTHNWKTDCSFGISDTNHYANNNRNLVWPGMIQMKLPWEIFVKCD